MSQITYRALIEPIPLCLNLANAPYQEASTTCNRCVTLIPDRSKAEKYKSKKSKDGSIKTAYERIDLFPQFPELKLSAKNGCELCRLIRKAIRSGWITRPMEEIGAGPLHEKNISDVIDTPWDGKIKICNAQFVATLTEDRSQSMVRGLNIQYGPLHDVEGHNQISGEINFKVFDQQDLESRDLENRRRLPSADALSPRNILMLKDWIHECKTSHPKCQAESSAWLPSRLLDVGSTDELPRLVETSVGDVNGRYAALSHMWGDTTSHLPLRTLKSNYEDMKAGILISDLPKNFAEAMKVCRAWDIQYVWIDSLCIIQDDFTDWKHEAALMHLVYRHAEVTIVATSALSTHTGFLSRTLPQLPAIKINYALPTSPETPTTMILQLNTSGESGFGQINTSTWNTRGWTMQERALSTRSVHFYTNKLYYECRQHARSEENEAIPTYTPEFYMWPRNEPWMKPLLNSSLGQDVTAGLSKRLYEQWKTMIHHYTLRNLTNGNDKLPAIRSMAEEMKASIQDEYIESAGMWVGNLEAELLWVVDDGPSSKPTEWRAPSWSWASMNGRIKFNSFTSAREGWGDEDRGTLMNAEIRLKDVGAGRGLNVGKVLRVRGFLQPLSFIEPVDPDERWLYFSRVYLPYDLYITSLTPLTTSAIGTSYTTRQTRESVIDKGEVVKFAEGRLDMDNKDNIVTSTRKLFYLHINYIRSPTGLILEEKGTGFERVGAASIFSEEDRGLIFPGKFKEGIEAMDIFIA